MPERTRSCSRNYTLELDMTPQGLATLDDLDGKLLELKDSLVSYRHILLVLL